MEKKYFYGIYGIQFIWHGEWSDPELIWHKKSFNYYDVESPLWDSYNIECEEKNKSVNEEDFAKWVKENACLVRDLLQNLMDSKCFYGA